MNVYRITLYFFILWAAIAGVTKLGDFAVESLADREAHNILVQSNVVEVDDVDFGTNPIQAGVEMFSWLSGTARTIAQFATFSAPNVWVGDLTIIRWVLLASMGGALVTAFGWETAKLVRG